MRHSISRLFCAGIVLLLAGGAMAQTTPAAPAQPAPVSEVALPASEPAAAPSIAAPAPVASIAKPTTYAQKDVLAAADDAFGKGAQGMGDVMKKVYADLGEPDGYIVGREAGGAFLFGVRYGSGTLFHKIEGQMPVFWTGPSFGVDFGADGSKMFILVYHLNDTNDLYRRFTAVQGKAYLIGGFSSQYLQRGDVILVPVSLGVGWRLGLNIGWLKLSRTSKIVPF